jgi:signal transduction histidine kinase
MSNGQHGRGPRAAEPAAAPGTWQARARPDEGTGAGTGAAGRGGLRILILENNSADAELEQRLLAGAGLDFTAVVVDTVASYEQQIDAFRPDVILADFALPGFSGDGALRIAQERCPDTPLVVVSGAIGDEAAVELIRKGATDYILKDRPGRLPSVIRRAVAEAEQRSRLARMQAQLQRAQRLESIGRLADGVAHELDHQVGAILSYAAFIRDQATGTLQRGTRLDLPGISENAGHIEQASQRVIKLASQLRAAGSRDVIRAEPIDLNKIIGGIDELLRSTAGPSTEFRLCLSPGLWPVTACPGHVEHILLNLTTNARDAMPDGGSFSIQTQNLTLGHGEAADLGLSSGSYVCLTARDSGTGMEPEVIEHAFEPFFTTKPSAEGGGLGLASVYGMTRQAGGTAAISSAPGTGTAVTVWLPAMPGHPAGVPGQRDP